MLQSLQATCAPSLAALSSLWRALLSLSSGHIGPTTADGIATWDCRKSLPPLPYVVLEQLNVASPFMQAPAVDGACQAQPAAVSVVDMTSDTDETARCGPPTPRARPRKRAAVRAADDGDCAWCRLTHHCPSNDSSSSSSEDEDEGGFMASVWRYRAQRQLAETVEVTVPQRKMPARSCVTRHATVSCRRQ